VRRLSVIGAALALLLALVGCGSGGDGDDDAAPTTTAATQPADDPADQDDADDADDGDDGGSISREDFIEQANEICRQGSADMEASAEDYDIDDDTEMSDESVERWITEALLPAMRQQIEDIRALGFPEGDEDELNSIFEDAEDAIDEIEDDPTAAIEGDEDPFEDINDRLEGYGLDVCAE
jgi:hypothetical protein